MKNRPTPPGQLSWYQRFGYGSGDMALNLFWQGTSYFLLYFYTNVVGIPDSTAGLIIGIGLMWDAFSDPMMGYLAERTRSRWGAYRPYLLLGCLPLSCSFALLFWTPENLEGTALNAFILITLLIFRSCYTLVSIPYSTLGARMTSDSRERTRLTGVRMMSGFLGGLIVAGLAALFRQNYDDQTAFRLLGVACAIISTAVLVFCFKASETAAHRPANAPRARNMAQAIGTLVKNRAFVLILISIALVAVGYVFINATVLYYFEDVIGNKTAGDRALMIMTATPLVTIPLWAAIALKLDKKNSWVLGSAVTVVGSIFLFLDRSGSVLYAYFTYILLNFGLSSFAILFWSMLPDTIEYGEHQTGIRNESTIIGVVSAGQKIALAISFYVLTLLLESIGYQTGASNPDHVIDKLRQLIAGIPAIALALSAISIAFYPVTAERHKSILSDLDERHNM